MAKFTIEVLEEDIEPTEKEMAGYRCVECSVARALKRATGKNLGTNGGDLFYVTSKNKNFIHIGSMPTVVHKWILNRDRYYYEQPRRIGPPTKPEPITFELDVDMDTINELENELQNA